MFQSQNFYRMNDLKKLAKDICIKQARMILLAEAYRDCVDTIKCKEDPWALEKQRKARVDLGILREQMKEIIAVLLSLSLINSKNEKSYFNTAKTRIAEEQEKEAA